MKRRVIQRRVVVFLLLLLAGGAIVNVAVAWGLGAFNILDMAKRGVVEEQCDNRYGRGLYEGYLATRWKRPGALRVSLVYVSFASGGPMQSTASMDEMLPKWASPVITLSDLDDHDHHWVYEREVQTLLIDGRGFPCLSMWGAMSRPKVWAGSVQKHYGVVRLDNYPTKAGDIHVRLLPLRPIWPGFAINTIFYAAILWVVFFVPGKLKRTLRRRRGQCPACAYDLRGSASRNCPECGTAIESG